MKLTDRQPKIIVVGSCSLDLILDVNRIPEANDTVIATKFETFFGGKGANQAVGVARLGASSYLVSCVGMDPSGQQIMRNLVEEEVNIGFVFEDEMEPTGRAYVASEHGKNSIIVVPSANYCLDVSKVSLAEKYFQTCDMVLLQLEIPMDVVEYTVKLAKNNGKKVGIYAAPAFYLKPEILDKLDFIIAKKSELKTIFGEQFQDEIIKKYPNKLFVRDDDNSTTYYNGSEMCYQSFNQNELMFKMGMGDAFTSGFSIALCHENTIEDCVRFGNKVSLKVAQQRGAQKGLPYLDDVVG